MFLFIHFTAFNTLFHVLLNYSVSFEHVNFTFPHVIDNIWAEMLFYR